MAFIIMLDKMNKSILSETALLSSALGEELSKAKNPSEDFVDETYMSSAQWLRLHGIQAKRLGFYEVLSSVAFRHQDGVIHLKVPPSDRHQISDAVSRFFFST